MRGGTPKPNTSTMKNLQSAQKKNALQNAQIYSLTLGCILGMASFIYAATLTIDNPVKQNLIFIIGFAELVVIFSIISIVTTRK